jgi:asparagine synthase (glutamine-hydrolysing)
MCGIVGIVEQKKQVEENLIINMTKLLRHRGPDDFGIWINSNKEVGLGHCRLSIIDLSKAGKQPMSDKSGKIHITYN